MIDSGVPMDKKTFTQTISECRRDERQIQEGELSLLFKMLDTTKDGYIGTDDFRSLESFNEHRRSPEPVQIALKEDPANDNKDPA